MKKREPRLSHYIMLFVVISGLAFLGLWFATTLLNRYISANNYDSSERIFLLYKNLQQHRKPLILILGSSNAREGIDAIQMERMLNKSYEIYNLGISGDDILRRATELEYLKRVRPEIVILVPVQYFFSNNYDAHDDLYAMAAKYINPEKNPELYKHYSERKKELMNLKYFGRVFYKRKYVVEFIFDALSYPFGRRVTFSNEKTKDILFKNISVYGKKDRADVKKMRERIKEGNSFLEWMNNYSINRNSRKKVFEYFVGELKKSGSKVVIVNMPLNPILMEAMNKEKNNNYIEYLLNVSKREGAVYIDYETIYKPYMFRDSTHLLPEGKDDFTRRLTRELMERGVV